MRLNKKFLTAAVIALAVAALVARVHMVIAQKIVIGAMFFLGGMLAVTVFGAPFEDRE